MGQNIQRRNFIKQGLVAGTGATLASARVLGANDRARIGVIGCGWQARDTSVMESMAMSSSATASMPG
jgi:hypothetical protein